MIESNRLSTLLRYCSHFSLLSRPHYALFHPRHTGVLAFWRVGGEDRGACRRGREAARFKLGRRLAKLPGLDACAHSRPCRRVTALPRATRLDDAFGLLSEHIGAQGFACRETRIRRRRRLQCREDTRCRRDCSRHVASPPWSFFCFLLIRAMDW